MSERNKPHNGRDNDGNFRVKRVDVDDTVTDPDGEDIIRDDVRKGGAVADIGAQAGLRAAEIGDQIAENRENVKKLAQEWS
ncbi:MAG TPA: hypothetical protein VGP25_15400 [Gemmatimonadaceae bacterium]|jgi:hypothetical protein|nr:hypothetical protein [Gemmatimonadaceae bacterium]